MRLCLLLHDTEAKQILEFLLLHRLLQITDRVQAVRFQREILAVRDDRRLHAAVDGPDLSQRLDAGYALHINIKEEKIVFSRIVGPKHLLR